VRKYFFNLFVLVEPVPFFARAFLGEDSLSCYKEDGFIPSWHRSAGFANGLLDTSSLSQVATGH
jgi:hypothetical protein